MIVHIVSNDAPLKTAKHSGKNSLFLPFEKPKIDFWDKINDWTIVDRMGLLRSEIQRLSCHCHKHVPVGQ